jgi:hypothetical protein
MSGRPDGRAGAGGPNAGPEIVIRRMGNEGTSRLIGDLETVLQPGDTIEVTTSGPQSDAAARVER